MARTTLDIDPSVLSELRRRGKREDKSMGQVASELLAGALAEPGSLTAAQKFSWTSGNLGAPRVDIEDKEGLRLLLDRPG